MIGWLLWIAIAFGGVGEGEAGAPQTAVVASLVVQVTQPVDAADALVQRAETLGGWFQVRTSDRVELRVPVGEVDGMVAWAAQQGKVADRAIARQDLTREIAEVAGRLAAREEVLERYYEVLEQAGPKSVVAVERQIVAAIEQIEALKGRLQVLTDRADWARVDVAFRFRDRSAPATDGRSSFPWLNTLQIQSVIAGHHTHRPGWRTRGVGVDAPPEGFSAWRKAGRYRAASPDGVLFRVRTVQHKPRADLAFWKEAVAGRMADAGYRVVREADLVVNGVAGGLIELAAPVGQEDWTYLVTFFPKGRRIVVAEAAGEVRRFDARRDAVLEGLAALDL